MVSRKKKLFFLLKKTSEERAKEVEEMRKVYRELVLPGQFTVFKIICHRHNFQ